MYEITHTRTMTQTNVKILNVPTNADYILVHKTNEGVINGNLNTLTLLYVPPPPQSIQI
jgi:hypothetical protein